MSATTAAVRQSFATTRHHRRARRTTAALTGERVSVVDFFNLMGIQEL